MCHVDFAGVRVARGRMILDATRCSQLDANAIMICATESHSDTSGCSSISLMRTSFASVAAPPAQTGARPESGIGGGCDDRPSCPCENSCAAWSRQEPVARPGNSAVPPVRRRWRPNSTWQGRMSDRRQGPSPPLRRCGNKPDIVSQIRRELPSGSRYLPDDAEAETQEPSRATASRRGEMALVTLQNPSCKLC